MSYSDRKLAGTLLFLGGTQFAVGMIVAEALYPGYSVSKNFISDLGVGPSALVFNSSVTLLGVLLLVGAYFVQGAFRKTVISALFALAGVGAIGVGIFPETYGVIHLIVSVIVFLFGGLAAIASYKLQKPPLSYLSVLLGVIALVAMVLSFTGINLGLGQGGMERMIAYPEVAWGIGFGGYLMGHPEK